MLDLILLTLLKYLSLLILARLLGTAIGFEFGISRQYLRFLEFLLYLGEKRIQKVESRSRLSSVNGQCETDDDGDDADKPAGSNQPVRSQAKTNGTNKSIASRSSCVTFATRPSKLDLILEDDDKNIKQICKSNCVTPSKSSSRRISTPDGPPVFLLDDSDLEDQADQEYTQHDDGVNPEDVSDRLSRIAKNYDKFMTSRPGFNGRRGFHLEDISKFVQKGIAAIVDDEVTKRFTKEELKTWNLLTRTDARHYQFMSKSLGLFWFLGLIFRYTCLFPLRVFFTLAGYLWLILAVFVSSMLPKKFNIRDSCYYLTSIMAFRMLSCGITSKLRFHNRQFRPKKGDICVANHTSPMDVCLLACDNCYALVGQRHNGLLGFVENLLSRATNHVWFDRSEMKDRLFVTERLKEHIKDRNNWPVLIFPEGTCINNSAVMLFRKGSFEISDRIFPIAMKYDLRFGDAFWDSSKYSYFQYLLMLMSSWAIKCDVWYLEPMDRLHDETAAEFANRVKAEIAKQAGLKDLNWDGQLKRQATKEIWREQQQEDFAKRLHVD